MGARTNMHFGTTLQWCGPVLTRMAISLCFITGHSFFLLDFISYFPHLFACLYCASPSIILSHAHLLSVLFELANSQSQNMVDTLLEMAV